MKDTELKEMRDSALYRTFVKGLEEGRFNTLREAADYCRNQPAPQFFISARVASLYIGRIMQGISLIDLNAYSRHRIWELYDRYVAFVNENPACNLTRERILEDLVEEPAPKFYLGVEMALKILKREKRKRRSRWS